MGFEDVSKNFSVAKVISILMVFTGHYFPGTGLWVPTAIALFVFGFSSSYFTAAKYSENFSPRRFWLNKVKRLGCNLLIINLFLVLLLMASGRKNLFSWHSVVSLFGLTGFLNWFKIPNESSLGLGLWFFTLLLIFYASYPVLSFLNRSKWRAITFVLLSVIILSVLHFTVPIGHTLWMTSISFIIGQFVYLYKYRLPPAVAFSIAVTSIIIMIILNFGFKIKYANYFLIQLTSIVIVMFLLVYKLPDALNWFSIFSGCVLEIYFISPYLTLRVNGLPVIFDYLISLASILIVALLLSYFAKLLQKVMQLYSYKYKLAPKLGLEIAED